MRSIEEKIDIPESRKDDFRREIMNYIGALAVEGKQFNYQTNERLHKALEASCSRIRKTRSSSPRWSPTSSTGPRKRKSTWSSSA